MTGQISGLPLELAAVVVAASMVLGAVDILRQPGWAWKQAGEPKVAYLILDLILPVIGLAMYAFRARPKVVAEVVGGPAAGTAEDTLAEDTLAEDTPAEDTLAADTPAADTPTSAGAGSAEPAPRTVATNTDPFTGFREMADDSYGSGVDHPSLRSPRASRSAAPSSAPALPAGTSATRWPWPAPTGPGNAPA